MVLLKTLPQNRNYIAYKNLVFGYGDVVKNKYIPEMPSDVKSVTAYVELQAVDGADDKILLWGSEELTQFIQEFEISTFIVSTTPGTHQEIIDYIFDVIGECEARIIVEKPFLSSSDLFTDDFSTKLRSKSNVSVYCIDHYLGKPVVGWLKDNIADLVNVHGKVNGIGFRSFEKKSFGNVDTFKIGYAIEHGVHALPCFEHILGPLFSSIDQIELKKTSVEYHDLDGVSIINKFDFEFCVDVRHAIEPSTSALLAPTFEVAIAGGKLHSTDEKILTIHFEKGEVVSGINSNQIWVNGESREVPDLNTQGAYSKIFRSIFSVDSNNELLLKPADAIKSVSLMEARATE